MRVDAIRVCFARLKCEEWGCVPDYIFFVLYLSISLIFLNHECSYGMVNSATDFNENSFEKIPIN